MKAECVVIQHHKNLNPSTWCEYFSLICQKSLLSAGIFCRNTKQYFLDITFVTSTTANLINDSQLHYLCIITCVQLHSISTVL